MRCWKQMETYFDGCAIWGSHSGASTTGKSSDDVMSIGSHISQVAAASIIRDWVVQQVWAPSSSNMASHRGRLESSTLIAVREQRLSLVAHDRTIWRAWAVAVSDYRDLPESYDSCFCIISRCCRPAAPSVHCTTSCEHSLVLLRMGEIIARNMLSWL